jgi:hypothetical protein
VAAGAAPSFCEKIKNLQLSTTVMSQQFGVFGLLKRKLDRPL